MSDTPRAGGTVLEEPLKSPLPYVERYKGKHRLFGRAVEVRIATGKADELFLREQALLERLDHPALPAVLRHGVMDGRPFYLIPLRPPERTRFLSLAREWSPTTRLESLLSVASALACLHRAGEALGGLHPSLLAWESDRGSASLPFPLAMAGYPPFGGLKRVPSHLEGVAARGPTRDVVCWAVLAYRLLTGVDEVFPAEGGPPTEVREVLSEVPRSLAKAIDRSLIDAAPPEDAAALLQSLGAEVLAPRAVGLLGARLGRADRPRQGSDRLQTTSPGAAPPGAARRQPLLELGVALGLSLALTLVALRALGPASPPASTPPPTVAATTQRRANFAGVWADPFLRALAARQQVAPREVGELLDRVRDLSRRGVLPARLDDPAMLRQLRQRHATDPEGAAVALEDWLRRLRWIRDRVQREKNAAPAGP